MSIFPHIHFELSNILKLFLSLILETCEIAMLNIDPLISKIEGEILKVGVHFRGQIILSIFSDLPFCCYEHFSTNENESKNFTTNSLLISSSQNLFSVNVFLHFSAFKNDLLKV